MEKEKSNGPDRLSSRTGCELSSFPVLNVVRANEYGMVVESSRSFDVGEAMNIGFHVSRGNESTFISAESVVVDSRVAMSDRGEFRHRVTLLFCDIAAEDRARLIDFSESLPVSEIPHPGVGLN